MNLSRRTFLEGAGFVVAAPLAWPLRAAGGAAPSLSVGILSDTHLKLTDKPDLLKGIFAEFKRRGTDVVVISGDVVDDGLVAEYEFFLRIWQEAFDDKPGKGDSPELFLVWGNHDYRAASKHANGAFGAEEADAFMVNHKDEVWNLLFGESFPGEVYARTYKGVSFVGAHWGHENEAGQWLAEHAEKVDTSRFFVYVQHPHPSGTVFLGMRTIADRVTADLSRYSNCFAISGHSHTNIGDDTALWQGSFTSMGAGTPMQTEARHGGGVPTYANGYFNRAAARPPYQHMAPCNVGPSVQGSVLSLYDSRVVVERIDFATLKHIGDDWVWPIPLERHPENPFVMPAGAKGPEFVKGARVFASLRNGCDGVGNPERQFYVHVPQARPVSRYGRAIWNRFEVVSAVSGKVLLAADALQPGQGLPLDVGMQEHAECAFAASDIPCGLRFKMRVTPMNAAGVSGLSIESEEMTL